MVAEIGGDFAQPARTEIEPGEEDGRTPTGRRRRGRRGRRGGGERAGAAAATGETEATSESLAEIAAEPSLFGDEPAPVRAAKTEALAPSEPDRPIAERPATPTPAAPTPEPAPPAEVAAPVTQPAEAAPASAEDRPRRSGWWQRARATLGGD